MIQKIKVNSNNIFEKITDIYIVIIILLFPLIVDSSGFFNILECKYNAFLLIACGYLIINLVLYFYFLLIKQKNVLNGNKITKVQIVAIILLAINIISCFSSPFFKDYNLLIGVGRGEGLIVTSLYILTFLCITLFGKFKKRYLMYFSISSILVNLVAILQYIGFNPFNMYQDGIGTHNVSFMGTIGNVDFISALYCILLTISCFSYVFIDDDKKLNKVIHLVSLIMGCFIFNIIDVNSGKVAFLATLVLVFPFIITNSKRFSRIITCINMVLLANCINYIMNVEYHYSTGKIICNFQFNYIVALFFVVIAILFLLNKVISKITYDLTKNKKIIIGIYVLYAVAIVIAILCLYFIDFKIGMLTEIHEILHGNIKDEYGTFRIFLWRRTLAIIKEYPLLGSGPDSFAIRFMSKYTQDIIDLGGELSINDTAANVYLTMTINIGILGLIVYLVFIGIQAYNLKKSNKVETIVLAIAIMCYLIQDFFNLWVVIITPIFWTLMAIYNISQKK